MINLKKGSIVKAKTHIAKESTGYSFCGIYQFYTSSSFCFKVEDFVKVPKKNRCGSCEKALRSNAKSDKADANEILKGLR